MKERNIVGLARVRPAAAWSSSRCVAAAARAIEAAREVVHDRAESRPRSTGSMSCWRARPRSATASASSVDFALLRDLEYYTGFIFEGYVPEIGFPLCGGGRYDSLLPTFGYDVPAVGWSAGVERILIALERRGKHIARRRQRVDVLVSRRRRRRGPRARGRQHRALRRRADRTTRR